MTHWKNYKWLYISMAICFVIMLIIFLCTDASVGMSIFLALIFGAILGFCLYCILRCTKIIAKDPQGAIDKFHGGKTKEERQLDEGYKRGYLSYMEYDMLKSKLKGETSTVEMMGYEAARAYSDKVDAEKALKQEIDNTDKKIIQNAVIGSAIGGLGGEIIGVATAASKQSRKIDDLTKQRDAADAKYHDELKKHINELYK